MDEEPGRWRQGPVAHLPARSPGVLVRRPVGLQKLDITSCTIITAAAGEPMRQIHDRQPVILDPAVYDAWLDPETPAADAKNLLASNLDGDLQFQRVSRTVNSVKNQGGDCIEPINPI